MTRPDLATVPPFYQGYVNHVKDMDLMEALTHSLNEAKSLIASIPESKGEYRYGVDKWSIKELLCHLLDAERIFAYRALRFARNDQTPLPGFEEKDYAPQANAHSRTVKQIADEFERLRLSTIDLYASFTPAMLQRKGSANNTAVSVLNLGYIISGHVMHHLSVLQSRYLTT